VKLKNNVAKDAVVSKDDVELDYNDQAVAFREAMEREKL
jgi:predicted homoserine dehydrogenase-like protein